ncbi:hypothetical protein WN55_03492 [Dufourea novaeangliae]|uniref:Uncharacterized protein n=1 Tax=Dufourea novaeangliae TaxID=178035 RepID=A0A154PJM1_DUFNO|nr:hypothetical protein WN55_03492 [Dufourea novaeangliae]
MVALDNELNLVSEAEPSSQNTMKHRETLGRRDENSTSGCRQSDRHSRCVAVTGE